MNSPLIVLPGDQRLNEFLEKRAELLLKSLYSSAIFNGWPSPTQIVDKSTLWRACELKIIEKLFQQGTVDTHSLFTELHNLLHPKIQYLLGEPWQFACLEVETWCKFRYFGDPNEGL